MFIIGFEKKKNYCLVHFENGRSYILSGDTVNKFGLCEGADVNVSEVLKYNEEFAYEYALECAFRSLAVSSKTAYEMRKKLYEKKFQTSAVISVIERLTDMGYINDAEYSRDFVEYKMESGLSRKAITSKLIEKGIDESSIEDAMKQYSYEDEYKFALYFAKKTAEQNDTLEYIKLRNKIYSRLASKGFDSGIISSVLDKIKSEYNDSSSDKDTLLRSAARMRMRGKEREYIFDTLRKKNNSADYEDILNAVLDELFQ